MSRPTRPTAMSKEQLESLGDADFFPHRQKKEDNTQERMNVLQKEAEKLFTHSKDVMPTKEEFPRLYQELPTLWAMITEGKFRYWNEKDQGMLRHMISLNHKVVGKEMSYDDAEKTAGDSLAKRFLPSS